MGVVNPGTYTFKAIGEYYGWAWSIREPIHLKQSESITDGRGQSGNLYM